MKRLALLSLLMSCLVSGWTARAAAQGTTGGIGGTGTPTTGNALDPNFDVKIDGETPTRGQVVYVTSDQCNSSVEFKFTVTNYQTAVPVLEVWASSTANCNMGSARAKNTTTTPSCWQLTDPDGELNQVMGQATFTTTATQIFRNGYNDTEGCPEQSNQKYTVYFVPLSTPTSANPNSPPDALSSIQQLKGTFTLYNKRPTAPSGVKGGVGQNRLSVSWDALSGVVSTTSYRAYFDVSVGDDPTCAGSLLYSRPVDGSDGGTSTPTDAGAADAASADASVSLDDAGLDASLDDAGLDEAGAADAQTTASSSDGYFAPDTDNKDIFSSSTKGTSASISDLDKKGVAIGEYVAAAVVTTDIAGNESKLSDVVCIQRVNTGSFLEACSADPNCEGGFQSCSLSPPSRRIGLFGLGLLLGLGIAFWVRRRLV
jgi:hypothetical protein